MSCWNFLKGFFIDNVKRWKKPYYALLAHQQNIKVRRIVEKIVSRSSLTGPIIDAGLAKVTLYQKADTACSIFRPTKRFQRLSANVDEADYFCDGWMAFGIVS
jgi:hypothetical protein